MSLLHVSLDPHFHNTASIILVTLEKLKKNPKNLQYQNVITMAFLIVFNSFKSSSQYSLSRNFNHRKYVKYRKEQEVNKNHLY